MRLIWTFKNSPDSRDTITHFSMMRETLTVGSSLGGQWGRAQSVRSGRLPVGCEVLSQGIQRTTMSEAEAKTTPKKMSKDVQIVAYLKANPKAKERGVMQSLDDNRDYASGDVSVSDYYRMVFAGGEKRVSEEEFEFLKAKDPAGIRLIHYQTESFNYDNNRYGFNRRFRDAVMRDIDMVMPGSDMSNFLGRKVQIDNETVFEVSASGPEKMRKLKHQSEVEIGDMYEDDETEYWTLTLRCQVNGLKPSLYRWFDNTVIPKVMSEVARHDWVNQVRVMDCEKEYSEEGVCFDI